MGGCKRAAGETEGSEIRKTYMPIIKIDNKDFNIDRFNDDVKAQLKNQQAV
jgi:hypothetical protein